MLENGHIVGELDGNASTASGIKDAGDARTLTAAYSKAGLAYADYSWLAA